MLIRGSSSVFRCWIRFRRSRRVSTVFWSPSGCSMTFVGPLTVIWPSYQNAVVGGKCSWRFSPIIAASRPWSSPLLLSRVSPHLLFCFHNSTTYPFEVAAWDVENWIFLADIFAHPSLPWRLSTPCRPRWNAIRLSSHGMQTTLTPYYE